MDAGENSAEGGFFVSGREIGEGASYSRENFRGNVEVELLFPRSDYTSRIFWSWKMVGESNVGFVVPQKKLCANQCPVQISLRVMFSLFSK
jgi:hypothetical protein